MDEHAASDQHLTMVPNSTTPIPQKWSPIPPKDIRKHYLARVRALRRPAGSLALSAISATTTAYFTGLLPHSRSLMALGLTALVVLYDSVIGVCRTWQKINDTRTASDSEPRPAATTHPTRRAV